MFWSEERVRKGEKRTRECCKRRHGVVSHVTLESNQSALQDADEYAVTMVFFLTTCFHIHSFIIHILIIIRIPAISTHSFHASAPRREEDKKEDAPFSKGGLLGTGVNEWYALPLGVGAAIPILEYQWFVINEELQLAACFMMFCVGCYVHGGDAVYSYFDDQAKAMLKEHHDAEDELIAAYQDKLNVLKMNKGMVGEFQAINKLREETYANLNKAGAIEPLYEFKGQMERALGMIIQEEASVADKAKHALMEEATATVSKEFAKSKELKKAALDSAIAKLKGDKAQDPVLKSFQQFFKAKAADAKKKDDGSEEKAQRDALVAKLNGVAKNEGFYFDFDANGNPKMVASS